LNKEATRKLKELNIQTNDEDITAKYDAQDDEDVVF